MKTIHAQLAPAIVATGLREVARRCEGVPGLRHPAISIWVRQARRGQRRPPTLNDKQIDAIADAVGVTIKIERK